MELTTKEMNTNIIIKAFEYLGISEIAGDKSNLVIDGMFKAVGFAGFTDDIAWCTAYVGAVLKSLGLDYLKSLHARDYADYGCATGEPIPGSVVVLWRDSEDSQNGHIGFFIAMDADNVWILGGNQNNQVTIQKYSRKRVISFRQALWSA